MPAQSLPTTPASTLVKHSRSRPTAPEADRLRWRRHKATQRARRSTGGFYAQVSVTPALLERLRTFVRLHPDDDLKNMRTTAELIEAAIEQGAAYRLRALEAEDKLAEFEHAWRT